MSIKTLFSIKDLENLSGIKAHTIRIWEKRYNLLQPIRSDTNIRSYDISNLQKLLNAALLNDSGYKVSKIASMKDEELFRTVREMGIEKFSSNQSINAFKLAMLNFDTQAFSNTYNQLLKEATFSEIFIKVFIPFLDQISLLWMSKTISPAHEHFISNLIKQKLLLNIERISDSGVGTKSTCVLFLPLNEIHELGLLYIHFELLLKGYKSIYLGSSVPIESITEVQNIFNDIVFISYLTVEPSVEKVSGYLERFSKEVLSIKNETLHIVGRNTRHLENKTLPNHITAHQTLIDLTEQF